MPGQIFALRAASPSLSLGRLALGFLAGRGLAMGGSAFYAEMQELFYTTVALTSEGPTRQSLVAEASLE